MQFEPPLFALGQTLAKWGHEVTCVGYWLPGLAMKQDICRNYRVLRVRRGDLSKLPRLIRSAVRLCRYYYGVYHLARKLKVEAVIAHNYDVLPIGAAVASSRIPLIYYCTEYADFPTITDYLIGWGFLKVIEAPLVSSCKMVLSVEESRARLQSEQWHRGVDHIVLNTPKYDESFHRAACIAVQARHDKPLRCVFAGRIDRRNHIDHLLKAIDEVPDATLDFWGPIPDSFRSEFTSLLSNSRAAAAGRAMYRGTMPYDRLKQELLNYDVGLSLYDSSETNTAFASPAKIGEYMRSGLAVIATDQPTPRAIIETSQCGRAFSHAKPDDLAAYLQELVDNPKTVRELRSRGLEAFRTRYNYDRQIWPLIQYLGSANANYDHSA
jgi:glycosyltransferase involved in cell wall biosynthesis